MSEIKVASRYAKSLLDLAIEQKSLDKVYNDMQLFYQVCKANRELVSVLQSPIITGDKKLHILTDIFGKKVEKLTLSFLDITVRKGREGLLVEIADSFFTQYNLFKGIVLAKVSSSSKLNEATLKEIVAKVEKMTGGKVELTAEVNPELIGGFVLTVGDKQFDASILHQMKGLKKAIIDKTYIPGI